VDSTVGAENIGPIIWVLDFLGGQSIENILNVLDVFGSVIQRYL
jgi:hypothetical protein